MNDLISRQAVFDIIDDLRDRMTVEGYWSMTERVKALPSAQPSPCEFCKHNDTSDDLACLRCSAERRTDEDD